LPEKGYVIYRDSELLGFAVRVLHTGSRKWIVTKWHQGREVRDTFASATALSAQEARKRARQLLGKIEGGFDPNAFEQQQKAADVTLNEVFDAYLIANRTRLSDRTKADYKYVVGRYLAAYRERPLAALTAEVVQELHQSIGATSKSWANYTARVIRLLYYYAAEKYKNQRGESLFPTNPVRILRRRWHKVFRRKSVIAAHLWPAWLKAVLRLEDDAARVWLLLQTLCGFRPGEAQRILRRDVDLIGRSLTIRGTKNKSDFVFPLPSYLRGVLRDYLDSLDARETYLFPSQGKKRPYRSEWRNAMDPIASTPGRNIEHLRV
jgi:integrase